MRFIVRACNAHYQLVEACKEALACLQHFKHYGDPAVFKCAAALAAAEGRGA
jgi:hypothetical protein